MVDLRTDYNYSVSRQCGKQRKRVLKQAIQDSNFDVVFEELLELVESFEGYKSERARQDLSYLASNQHKYYTDEIDYRPKVRDMRGKQVAES